MSKINKIKKSTAKGKIEFEDCYSLYKFFEALSSLVDEIPLVIESDNNQLVIIFMDTSRICLIEVVFGKRITNVTNLKNFLKVNLKANNPYSIDIKSDGKDMVSVNDLKDLLRVRKGDKKTVSLVFKDPYRLLLEKKADSLGVVKKNLNYLNIEIEDIPTGTLDNIEYLCVIGINQKLFSDFFYEAGIYSEVIGLEINKKGIHFTEEGVIGNSDIFYESGLLNYHNISTDMEKGSYSLTYLNLVKPIIGIMEENDVIKIELKTDHPLKVSISFDNIGAKITYYLAARVEEAEFDEDTNEF